MRKYIKPRMKLILMSDELCEVGLNGSGGDGEQLGKDHATFDEEPANDMPEQRNVWDE